MADSGVPELTVRPTGTVDLFAGGPVFAQRWEGTSAKGAKVVLWVCLIRVEGDDQEEFQRALVEVVPPGSVPGVAG